MSSWAELGGNRIQSGSITVPYYGCLAADVLLASSATVDAQTTLTVGNLSLAVHVVRQASFAGSRSFRLVGGFGGWRKTVGARWYYSPASLPLATVLGDVATEIGETVSVPAARLLGSQYARSVGPAARVLEQLAPDWWIAPDGVTHVGPRDGSLITTDKTIVNYSGSKGQFTVATEDMASWLPGRTFTSQTITDPITIGAVTIAMTNDGKVRLDVLSSSSPNVDRLTDPLDEIISSRFPSSVYSTPWECTIVSVSGSGPWTIDVIPTSPACPLPGMTTVSYRPSIAGARVQPKSGGTCLVQFVNGDPQRPFVSVFDDTVSSEIDLRTGYGAMEHATSAEALIVAVQNLGSAIAAGLAELPAVTPTATTGALAAVLLEVSSNPAAQAAVLETLIGAMSDGATGTIDLISYGLLRAALLSKSVDSTGMQPSVGWPTVRGG